MYHVGRWIVVAVIMAFVVLSSGCSQSPAQIGKYGDRFYGFGSSGSAYSSNSAVSAKSNNHGSKKYIWVKVREGDTLSEIADDYDVSMKRMASINRIRKPYRLKVGQILKVGKASYHVVEKGDTLRNIADNYAVNMNKLASANKLSSPYTTRVGQKVYMPGASKNTSTRVASSSKKRNYSKSNKKKKYARRSSGVKKKSISVAGAPKFSWPVRGRVINSFGAKSGGVYNDGINIAAPEGSAVRAAADGTVVYVGDELKSYGNLVIIQHKKGWLTAYAYNKSISVKRGQKVKKGQKIARVGSTGKATKSQLHFAVRKGRQAVNPSSFISS